MLKAYITELQDHRNIAPVLVLGQYETVEVVEQGPQRVTLKLMSENGTAIEDARELMGDKEVFVMSKAEYEGLLNRIIVE